MSKEESVLELLHKASRQAKYDDLVRQDMVSWIRFVMEDMLAMKDVVNTRDVERWYNSRRCAENMMSIMDIE